MTLRRLILLVVAAAFLMRGDARAADQPGSLMEDWWVYIGTYSGENSRGIYRAHFNTRTGVLGAPELSAEVASPSFLALHPSKDVLYAVSETWDAAKPEGSVHAFEIQRPDGKLTAHGQQSSGGQGPCHLTVERSGRAVLVANYGNGSIAAVPLDKAGRMLQTTSIIQHRGSSVNQARQSGPHAHVIVPDPRNRFALVCDLGLDKVLVYKLGRQEPWLTPNEVYGAPVTPGAGPRHLAFHPDGRSVYVINEMGSSIDVFSYGPRDGALTPVQTVSTLPAGFAGESSCAEIQVHPSGKFVYASNRGHDSIAVYAWDGAGRRLTLVEHQSTLGKTPRHFAIAPGGRWLLAENQDSDSLVVFRIDPATGRLTASGGQQKVGKPVCAVFVRAGARLPRPQVSTR